MNTNIPMPSPYGKTDFAPIREQHDTTLNILVRQLPEDLRADIHDIIASNGDKKKAAADLIKQAFAYHAALGSDGSMRDKTMFQAGLTECLRYRSGAEAEQFYADRDNLFELGNFTEIVLRAYIKELNEPGWLDDEHAHHE